MKAKKYIISEDIGGVMCEIGKTETLKMATRIAKAEAIKRSNSVYVRYDQEYSSFEVGFDPTGKQYSSASKQR